VTEADWRTTRVTWIILHPRNPEVLAAGEPGDARLPVTELPGDVWMGEPEVTTGALNEQLGLDTVMLYCANRIEDRTDRVQELAIVATPRPGADLPGEMRWVGTDEAGGPAAVVASLVLAELTSGSLQATRPPWALPGWFTEAESWLRSVIEPQGYQVIGPARQVRVWDMSCVLRVPTTRGDVYLKAAAESSLFANEATVVPALAELFPARVPAPLAADSARRWLALPDHGAELARDETHWSVPIDVREAVIAAAARMQREAASHAARLGAAGCLNRDLGWLAGEATSWLPIVAATADQPGIDAASWLTAAEAAELAAAAPRLATLCTELAGYAVPITLVHGDLLLSNVAAGPAGYLFFDWTDACLAHPFVDMLDIHQEEDAAVRDRLRDAYLREWTGLEPLDRLLRAWMLAEPLAALHHAISYRSIVAEMRPPIDGHMMESTAYWLRKITTGLHRLDDVPLGSGS
jgi:hypothetical protein